MSHLQHKLKPPSLLLKWLSSNFSFKTPVFYIHKNPTTLYTTLAAEKDGVFLDDDENETPNSTPPPRRLRHGVRLRLTTRGEKEAQSALLENLHGTGNLPFTDAEHMSKNCPIYINSLIKKLQEGEKEEIGRSLTKFFRYNPINEFEPFFESMGLKPSEVNLFLPRNLMFLKDDPLLFENYHVLCNYGVPRSMIGKFYKEAMGVFKYDPGVLHSKLLAYEGLGLNQSSVIKVVLSSPSLLIGSVNEDFVKMLDLVRSSGIEFKWIVGRLSDKKIYNWSQILGIMSFVCEMGYSKEELGRLMKANSGLLLDVSGRNAFNLVGFMLKLGSSTKEISSLLLQFPRIQLGTFMKNLRQCLLFLMEVEMEAKDIGKIVRAHPLILGSCSLKKPSSVLGLLNVGKKRICNIIMEDPYQLKNWVMGLKIEPLPNSGENERSLKQKTEFLLTVGFIENSDEFKKALKVFRGKGYELQERFDCFVKAGLERSDVIRMIKVSPHVMSQTKDMIEQKVDFLVNGLCYPIATLAAYPSYISCATEKVKLRFSMYTWLRDEGLAAPNLALSTVLACTEKIWINQYVKRHPRGLEVYENLKKEHCV